MRIPAPKETLNPDAIFPPAGAYSQVIVAPSGRLVFISGQAAVDRQGKIVGRGDIKAQARQVLENVKAALEAAGGSLANVVSVTVFAIDISRFSAIHEVRREFFPADYPASTLVEGSRLVHPDLLIEISAVAVVEQAAPCSSRSICEKSIVRHPCSSVPRTRSAPARHRAIESYAGIASAAIDGGRTAQTVSPLEPTSPRLKPPAPPGGRGRSPPPR